MKSSRSRCRLSRGADGPVPCRATDAESADRSCLIIDGMTARRSRWTCGLPRRTAMATRDSSPSPATAGQRCRAMTSRAHALLARRRVECAQMAVRASTPSGRRKHRVCVARGTQADGPQFLRISAPGCTHVAETGWASRLRPTRSSDTHGCAQMAVRSSTPSGPRKHRVCVARGTQADGPQLRRNSAPGCTGRRVDRRAAVPASFGRCHSSRLRSLLALVLSPCVAGR